MDQDIYEIKMKVTSQKGTCVAGHKGGDEFETSRVVAQSFFVTRGRPRSRKQFGGQPVQA